MSVDNSKVVVSVNLERILVDLIAGGQSAQWEKSRHVVLVASHNPGDDIEGNLGRQMWRLSTAPGVITWLTFSNADTPAVIHGERRVKDSAEWAQDFWQEHAALGESLKRGLLCLYVLDLEDLWT